VPVRFTFPPNRLDFNLQVWEIVRRIPVGKVMTYGQIGLLIPCPANITPQGYRAFAPRWVGGAMAACPQGVPWQRVINSQGRLSVRGGAEKQRQLLEGEGVEFDDTERIDLRRFQFIPN
jgi:methylated-DNA-protein-cysteine methyltransferase related protein